jgi:hypothetical protein
MLSEWILTVVAHSVPKRNSVQNGTDIPGPHEHDGSILIQQQGFLQAVKVVGRMQFKDDRGKPS